MKLVARKWKRLLRNLEPLIRCMFRITIWDFGHLNHSVYKYMSHICKTSVRLICSRDLCGVHNLHCESCSHRSAKTESFKVAAITVSLQRATHNFPPLTCSACGVVAMATAPSQRRRCSISTGLLDLWSHSPLLVAFWENQSHRIAWPLFYLSQSLFFFFIILQHYNLLKTRQGVIYFCFQSSGSKQLVWMLTLMNIWLLRSSQRHTEMQMFQSSTWSIYSSLPEGLLKVRFSWLYLILT